MVIGLVVCFILFADIPMRHKIIGLLIGALALSGCAVQVDAYGVPVYTNPVVVQRTYIHRPYVHYGPYYRNYSPAYRSWRAQQLYRHRHYCC